MSESVGISGCPCKNDQSFLAHSARQPALHFSPGFLPTPPLEQETACRLPVCEPATHSVQAPVQTLLKGVSLPAGPLDEREAYCSRGGQALRQAARRVCPLGGRKAASKINHPELCALLVLFLLFPTLLYLPGPALRAGGALTALIPFAQGRPFVCLPGPCSVLQGGDERLSPPCRLTPAARQKKARTGAREAAGGPIWKAGSPLPGRGRAARQG